MCSLIGCITLISVDKMKKKSNMPIVVDYAVRVKDQQNCRRSEEVVVYRDFPHLMMLPFKQSMNVLPPPTEVEI